jgi:hypothetical protein
MRALPPSGWLAPPWLPAPTLRPETPPTPAILPLTPTTLADAPGNASKWLRRSAKPSNPVKLNAGGTQLRRAWILGALDCWMD